MGTGEGTADAHANNTTLTMQKPSEKLHALAILIVYSMAADSKSAAPSPGGLTPSLSPSPSATNLTVPATSPTYLAGSKALDSLAKLIQATETFFHPSNWGTWSIVLARFLQNVTWEFLKRWKVIQVYIQVINSKVNNHRRKSE